MSEPLAIEYASTVESNLTLLLAVAQRLMVLSILSGLCVAVCFAPAIAGPLLGGAAHFFIFALTIALAIWTGRGLQRLTGESLYSRRTIADGVALLGLTLFSIVPLLVYGDYNERLLGSYATVVFGCLASTAWRHVLLYRLLAQHSLAHGLRGSAKSLRALGGFKTVYESLWLGCCFFGAFMISGFGEQFVSSSMKDAAILPLFGAMFGCVGFGGVWLWMMLAHGLWISALKRAAAATAAGHAFEVGAVDEIPVASPALPADGHVEVFDQ